MANNKPEDKKPIPFDRVKASELCYSEVFGGDRKSNLNRIVNGVYGSFKNHVYLALRAAQNKQALEADYFVVDRNNDYRLTRYLKVKIKSKMSNGKPIPDDETVLATLRNIGVEVKDIFVDKINVDGKEIPFHVIDDEYVFEGENNSDVIVNDNPDITIEKDVYCPEVVKYNGQQYPVRKYKVAIQNYTGGPCEDGLFPNIKYELTKDDDEQRENEITIELIENPYAEMSVYDVFFTENLQSVFFDDQYKTYKVKYSNKETGRIVLQLNDTLPAIKPEGKIHVTSDTYQLKCQMNANDAIVNRPCIDQKPLLDLCFDYKELPSLESFPTCEKRFEYVVLTDASRPGTSSQRDFVKKAMQTPDFMILQGPPGSGKTTAILELVYQLCKEGKKVLLCASTHVAVDNVLEKIVTHPQSEELLKIINPIRVGEEYNVSSDKVKPFTIGNLMEGSNPDYEEIVNNSFNLVCGTVVGVLKFPLIKNKIADIKGGTIYPMFDYLILDEASKTTFSEFLVPAVLCKRWIIVGDVKQLAPYVEKNDLVPSLLECEPLKKKEDRLALSLLMQLNSQDKRGKLNESAFILPTSTIDYIDNRITIPDNVIAVSNHNLRNIERVSKNDFENNSLKLACLSAEHNILLIDSALIKETIPFLNSKMLVLNPEINISSDLLFNTYQLLKFRGNFGKDYFKKYNEYSSRTLENEILWRLIRLYELKDDEGAVKGYNEFFKDLRSCFNDEELVKYDNTINTLSNIAIPSIIMILQEGVNRQSKYFNRLTKGLTKQEKENRFVMLEYQHRMHPDISKISRDNVYKGVALLDSDRWTSNMSYLNDKKKFEIRDISGTVVDNRNFNEKEANAILKELDEFIKFTKTHKKANGKMFDVAILSFYNAQVVYLRKKLKERFHSPNSNYNFFEDDVHVTLNTVDKFQGQEADVVYISMVQNKKVGFLDSVNRVNVAITRAKEKVVIFGDKNFFVNGQDHSTLLKKVFKEA